MKFKIAWMAALVLAALPASAAVPPPEQLLSSDTVAMLAVPDCAKYQEAFAASPWGQLWQDTEIKAFKDKLVNHFQETVISPLEKQLGVKFADYAELVRGEAVFALTFKPGEGESAPDVGWCLLIDSKDKSEQLKKSLEDLKKKWVDAGKQLKSEKIREIEFTSVEFTGDDLTSMVKKAFPGGQDKEESDEKSTNKVTVIVGQSGSLLMIGDNAKGLEKVLARQSGGQVPPLAEVPEYQSNQAVFRDALGFGWINLKPIFAEVKKALAQAGAKGQGPMPVKPDKVFNALGVDGIKTLSYSISASPEGSQGQFFINVSEADRKGLIKIFSFESKTAGPPPFAPADAVKFNRWRLDGQKAWASLKNMVTEISPELSGIIQMGLATAGKDKDPNFDLEKSLIGNLGDDIIVYEKSPKDFKLESLSSPPSLILIGSPNADALAQAMFAGSSLAVPPNQVKQREFVGRKITSLPLPAMPNSDGENDKTISFASGNGYVALSTDEALLEEYLRGTGSNPKPLSDFAGLKEASQKVGGMESGLWGFENQAETIRIALETLKKDASSFEHLFNLTPLGKNAEPGDDKEGLKAWLDFSLLPPFEKISKYFSFVVYGGTIQADGFSFKAYSPTPAGLKK